MNKFRVVIGKKLLSTRGAELCISFSMETAKGETKHRVYKFLKGLYEMLPETAEDWI